VKPYQGSETMVCSSCRYEFDLFSGTVLKTESEAPETYGLVMEDLLKVRFFGGRRGYTHTFTIESPTEGISQVYKCGTEGAEVPAKVGDRVTMISASASKSRNIKAIPPGWKSGEPKALYNHRLGRATELFLAAKADSGISLQWLVLGAALFAGGDASTGLINPDFPALIVAGTVGLGAVSAVATQFVLPQLAKLPSGELAAVEYRQQFLGQYGVMKEKLDDVLASACEDIQLLSRLWTLHHKIEAVGGTYEARLRKITTSAELLEQKIAAKIRLVEGYSKVRNLIEIEVELESNSIEDAEAIAGISQEMDSLREMEELKEEWSMQVEAKDEIEKILGDS